MPSPVTSRPSRARLPSPSRRRSCTCLRRASGWGGWVSWASAGRAGAAPARGVGVRLTLAPALPGPNTTAAPPVVRGRAGRAERTVEPRSIAVTLRCACARAPVRALLRRGRAGTWAATVELPAGGTFLAAVSVDGSPGDVPAALTVGDASVPGSSPRDVLMTADLTGPDALRCRAQAEGAILAVGRFDARGGLPGGRKVVVRVDDDGGDPGRAAALVRGRRAIALLAPCGAGAAGALRAAGALPALAADPAVAPISGRRIWRTVGDPHAEGLAVGRYMLDRGSGLLARAPRRVAAVAVPPGGASSAARLAGLQEALAPAGGRPIPLPPETPSHAS